MLLLFLYYPFPPDIINADKKQQETGNSKNNKVDAHGKEPVS